MRSTARLTRYDNWGEYCRKWLHYYEEVVLNDPFVISVKQKNLSRATASFQCLADAQQLKVYRYSGYKDDECHPYQREWFHSIDILDRNDKVVACIGGYIEGPDVVLGGWDKTYVEATEVVDADHIRIQLMLGTEPLPDFPEFLGVTGQPIDFRDHDGERTFQPLEICLHREDVVDEFHDKPLLEKYEQRSKERTMARCTIIKEELMMNRWHPIRVERLLLAGYDMEDM